MVLVGEAYTVVWVVHNILLLTHIYLSGIISFATLISVYIFLVMEANHRVKVIISLI